MVYTPAEKLIQIECYVETLDFAICPSRLHTMIKGFAIWCVANVSILCTRMPSASNKYLQNAARLSCLVYVKYIESLIPCSFNYLR